VNQTQEFKAREISVGLFGRELTFFESQDSSDSADIQGKRPFVLQEYTVAKIEDPNSLISNQSYDFEFRVPEWLPESTLYRA